MLRAVCVGINIVENADVVGVRAGFAVQRLVKRGAPAIAQTEIILIHIAGIVEVLYRGRQAQAAGGKIRQGENHIAVRQADICRARAPDIQRIIGQILLQARQAGIFQHKVGLAAAAGGFHHHRVGPAPLGCPPMTCCIRQQRPISPIITRSCCCSAENPTLRRILRRVSRQSTP